MGGPVHGDIGDQRPPAWGGVAEADDSGSHTISDALASHSEVLRGNLRCPRGRAVVVLVRYNPYLGHRILEFAPVGGTNSASVEVAEDSFLRVVGHMESDLHRLASGRRCCCVAAQ